MDNPEQEKAETKSERKFIWLIFFVLALFLIGAGAYAGFESFQMIGGGGLATGVVIDYHERISDDDRQVQYAAVVEYGFSGQTYRLADLNYQYNPTLQLGDTVQVVFSTEDPGEARINRFTSLWGLPIALVSVGVILMLISLGGLFRKKRGRRS